MDMRKMIEAQRRGYALGMHRRASKAAFVYGILMVLAFLVAIAATLLHPDLLLQTGTPAP